MGQSQTPTRFVFPVFFLLFLGLCSAAQRTATPQDLKHSCGSFVQEFYNWYVPRAIAPNSGRALDIALKHRSSDFNAELVRQLREDSKAQDKTPGEIVGLDFDPFLASQDPSEQFAVSKVTSKGGTYSVEVLGMSSGVKREKVIAELVQQNGHWIFVNFRYPDFKDGSGNTSDLLGILKNLRDERLRYPK